MGTEMPKRDIWSSGSGLETVIGMARDVSCDSFVSGHSGCVCVSSHSGTSCFHVLQSDDNLDHLSAEEKACLLFLEETIKSLDNEQDSILSNEEPEQLPNPDSLAPKRTHLSTSVSKFVNSQKPHSKALIQETDDTKPVQLVPTPFLVASSSSCSNVKPGVLSDNKQPDQKNKKATVPTGPLEVNVVIPPPTKPKDVFVKTAEGPLPRGPLSYDALVHLRKSASMKKTPLCPTVDHTIDLGNDLPVMVECLKPGSDRSHSQVPTAKVTPPIVAPKPKMVPAKLSVKIQNEASIPSDSLYRVKHVIDPEAVRLEALQKLGLLKEEQAENDTVRPPPPLKSYSLDPTPNSAPGNVNVTSRMCSESNSKSLQSSASSLHISRRDQEPVPASYPSQSNGLKASSLEHSATLTHHTDGEAQHVRTAKTVETISAAQPAPPKASNAVGYSVMVVPGMGADRKEALRKLGLLKN